MSRIDAVVAPNVGDVSRPAQAVQDAQLQSKQAQGSAASQADSAPVSADDLRAAAGQLKQVIEIASGRQLSFEINIDRDSKALYVQIRDIDSGEVLKQLPSAEVLDLRKRLDKLVGIMIDKHA
jgi:flagellar protein FlaG